MPINDSIASPSGKLPLPFNQAWFPLKEPGQLHLQAEASVLMCSDGTDVSSFDDSDQGLQVNYQVG